jgi:hypothetical protein
LITMFDAEYLYHINHYSLKDHWFQEWILQCWLSHSFIWPIRWYMKVWGSRSRSCVSVTLYFIQSLKFVTNDSPGICKIPHQSIQDSNRAIHPVVHRLFQFFKRGIRCMLWLCSLLSHSLLRAARIQPRYIRIYPMVKPCPFKRQREDRHGTLFGASAQSPLIHFYLPLSLYYQIGDQGTILQGSSRTIWREEKNVS